MERAAEGHTLTIGEQRVAMQIADSAVEAKLRDRLAKGGPISARLAPAESGDVEGHVFQVAQPSVAINLQLDDDDVEGHAISLHFPSLEEAERFRRGLLAAGVLAGTIAIGSAGAIAISSQPASSELSYPAQVQAYERPAGHGMLQGADVADVAAPAAAASTTSAVDPATGKPVRSGFQQSAEIGAAATTSTATAAATTGIDPATGKPSRSGFQERADSGGASGLSGTQSAERPAGSGPLEGADR